MQVSSSTMLKKPIEGHTFILIPREQWMALTSRQQFLRSLVEMGSVSRVKVES